MLDFLQHWHISPERFASWHGRALFLESDLERDVTPQERANTEALFVNPSIHVFHHAGHVRGCVKRPQVWVCAKRLTMMRIMAR